MDLAITHVDGPIPVLISESAGAPYYIKGTTMYGFATLKDECWCFLVKEGSQLPFPLLLPLDLKCMVPGNKVNKVNGVKGQPPVLLTFELPLHPVRMLVRLEDLLPPAE